MKPIPVIDIFAGPGGLGEGFASHRSARGEAAFRLALSVEKDRFAHSTLALRSLFRHLEPRARRPYWKHLQGKLSRDELFEANPNASRSAAQECLHLELGPENAPLVRTAVQERLAGVDEWVLIGGPPCQAYSLVGRARNRGNPKYRAVDDHRHTLYVEYLQILADHQPAIFVMENVKGLLSATLVSQKLFDRIREDLANPAAALRREGRRSLARPRYRLLSLAGESHTLFGDQPTDYVVRAERHGVPQARHRVIIVGVLEGSGVLPSSLPLRPSITVRQAIGELPPIRSGITDADDNSGSWLRVIAGMKKQRWFRQLSPELRDVIAAHAANVTSPPLDRGAEFLAGGSMDGSSVPVLNHSSRAHIRCDLERYFFSSAFAQVNHRSPVLADFPEALLPNHRNVASALKGGMFSDRFRVQLQHRPSSTITSHISKDGHYYIHYDPHQCRSLTVREAARLQTFPDDYFFCGPRTAQYQQVGNAVPPKLATQIAKVIHETLL